jgi:hypothetical protein
LEPFWNTGKPAFGNLPELNGMGYLSPPALGPLPRNADLRKNNTERDCPDNAPQKVAFADDSVTLTASITFNHTSYA